LPKGAPQAQDLDRVIRASGSRSRRTRNPRVRAEDGALLGDGGRAHRARAGTARRARPGSCPTSANAPCRSAIAATRTSRAVAGNVRDIQARLVFDRRQVPRAVRDGAKIEHEPAARRIPRAHARLRPSRSIRTAGRMGSTYSPSGRRACAQSQPATRRHHVEGPQGRGVAEDRRAPAGEVSAAVGRHGRGDRARPASGDGVVKRTRIEGLDTDSSLSMEMQGRRRGSSTTSRRRWGASLQGWWFASLGALGDCHRRAPSPRRRKQPGHGPTAAEAGRRRRPTAQSAQFWKWRDEGRAGRAVCRHCHPGAQSRECLAGNRAAAREILKELWDAARRWEWRDGKVGRNVLTTSGRPVPTPRQLRRR